MSEMSQDAARMMEREKTMATQMEHTQQPMSQKRDMGHPDSSLAGHPDASASSFSAMERQARAELVQLGAGPVVVESIPPVQNSGVNAGAPAVSAMTLDHVRARLGNQTGRRFWRSMDELGDTPEFHEMLRREFPRQAADSTGELVDAVSRRGFMKIMGASLALAGLAGCTKQPDEPIFPYIQQPEDLVLGKPMYFATAYPFPTGAVPLLVKTDAFRPIKIEGNPEHPYNKGKSDIYSQASLLALYDPDRSQRVLYRGETSSWPLFQQAFLSALAVRKASGGQGIYFLSETITSPTLAAQWKQAQAAYPNARLVQYDPINNDSARAASKAAFGGYKDAQYDLDGADVILSLDAPFLSGIAFPGFLKLSAQYAERRRVENGKPLNRLYVVESTPTTTGFKAEHRLALRPSDLEAFATGLASGSGFNGAADAQKYFQAVLADLKAHNGKCVVIPGEQASVAVHRAAMTLNQQLGAVGKTVVYGGPVNPMPTEQLADFKSLVADLGAGKVEWLVMLESNPLYSAPADLGFDQALMNKAKVTVHLGAYVDETGSLAQWQINKAHYLESWSDARAYDGTLSIIQPMIDPLYGGKTAHDVFQTMLDNPLLSAYEAVRANNKAGIQGDFETGWRKALHAGFIEAAPSASKTTTGTKGGGATDAARTSAGSTTAMSSVAPNPSAQQSSPDALEIIFRPDPNIYDGRFANLGWLQELPKPVTNLSWDNAALMSMAQLTKLGLKESDVIEIESAGRKVKAPVLMMPGHPDGSITVYLGNGRRIEAGRVGAAVGFNAYGIRSTDSPLYAGNAKVSKTADVYDVCVTKSHYIDDRGKFAQTGMEEKDFSKTHSLEGNEAMQRGIIRYATLDQFKVDPNFAHEGEGKEDPAWDETMFKPWNYKTNGNGTEKYAWAMSIDMNSCVGCNACVVACYAENNIPVVGREQVKIGRNMQWIRIDTYFEGDLETPKAHFQPMACQHCENAGCEQVCPVGATVHTPEGLNTMVYNRCVGTRYCSNNCPYKVRRFNFLLYADYETESLKFMRNPDVTVRSRGVMEKCSYCIQRIQAAKIEADKNNRVIADGEVITACQQACPTDAIIFGNQNDPSSKVAKLKTEQRSYSVLGDLNFRPRTQYMAGVVNPNPALAPAREENSSAG